MPTPDRGCKPHSHLRVTFPLSTPATNEASSSDAVANPGQAPRQEHVQALTRTCRLHRQPNQDLPRPHIGRKVGFPADETPEPWGGGTAQPPRLSPSGTWRPWDSRGSGSTTPIYARLVLVRASVRGSSAPGGSKKLRRVPGEDRRAKAWKTPSSAQCKSLRFLPRRANGGCKPLQLGARCIPQRLKGACRRR